MKRTLTSPVSAKAWGIKTYDGKIIPLAHWDKESVYRCWRKHMEKVIRVNITEIELTP